ncbi:alpha/beta fold hydrolase [Altererythrobacter lutimaris]|uniref:Alpha/beta hydrolase n=1 Tax=Altererythrobacter lutimaris TaxID=2743979 RepID=A0A850HDZ3_9SPHN|nr:alpha/beta hydrolase [Altererythrobacter lutimaris]NVE95266.1 alpha/beta hydrolase [Altererythrobacter lutimaris]
MKTLPSLMASLALLISSPALAQDNPQACAPYESIGSGPDLILTPGLGSAPEVWDGVKDSLSENYTVHLVHVAGFAGRAAQGDPETILDNASAEIIAYMNCKGIETARYAGHSMGGFLGLKLAAEEPSRIDRLVIVDSLPFFPLIFSPQASVAAVVPQADGMRTQILGQTDEQFAQSQQTGVRSLVQNADFHETVVGWSLASDRTTFANALHTLMTTDLRPELANVMAPTTVIAASNAFAPRERVEALYAGAYDGLEGAQVAIVEDSFHFIMFDQPEAFASALEAALASE